MEILSPAGSREALERAQAAGADAVYLGFSAFSARAGAGNFGEEELAEAVSFAHLHQMRVYVTVNTLVKDGELQEVKALLRLLCGLRVDGVLVQDLGILRMIRRDFPGLRVHASTQMAIHNASGAAWCSRLGMKRVVLARECSLEEIRACAETGIEIEVFAHGAQCVAVSGECLFSSMVGERSGNRGRCAQPCRKMYWLDGKKGAWLSPRDLCLRDRIPQLAGAGVASLKIEGRLKRPEYVYTVTESYRRGLDSLTSGEFLPASEEEKKGLKQIFHRGGFMTGYAFGAEDAGVIQPASVNHQGIRIGKVIAVRGNLARVELEVALHNGDGLRILRGDLGNEMTYSGPEVSAKAEATVRLREGTECRPGDPVYRLTDAIQQKKAMDAPLRKIPVDFEMEAFPNRKLKLQAEDGERRICLEGDICQAARNREITGEEMEKQLRKAGGTDFEIRKVSVRTAGAFIPLSRINELRRKTLERLAEQRMEDFAYPKDQGDQPACAFPAGNSSGMGHFSSGTGEECFRKADISNRLLVTVRSAEQAEACRGKDTLIIWYPEDFRTEALERTMNEMEPGDWLRLPEVCEENTLQEIHRAVSRQKNRLGGVMLGSVGQMGLSWPVPLGAGPGVPVMNRETARLLREEGCAFVTASPELTGAELKILSEPAEDLPPVILQAYGRTQLMLLHHCPARTVQGWSQGHGACRLCEDGQPQALRGKALEDERGYRFPLMRLRLPEGCLVRLMNALPTNLADQRTSMPRMLEMTGETPEEASGILGQFREYRRTGESTRGHWNRAVL